MCRILHLAMLVQADTNRQAQRVPPYRQYTPRLGPDPMLVPKRCLTETTLLQPIIEHEY
jgi:hypothetical protein